VRCEGGCDVITCRCDDDDSLAALRATQPVLSGFGGRLKGLSNEVEEREKDNVRHGLVLGSNGDILRLDTVA
jgi:hypothetical protein